MNKIFQEFVQKKHIRCIYCLLVSEGAGTVPWGGLILLQKLLEAIFFEGEKKFFFVIKDALFCHTSHASIEQSIYKPKHAVLTTNSRLSISVLLDGTPCLKSSNDKRHQQTVCIYHSLFWFSWCLSRLCFLS